MIIMSVDVGTARTGVALSDKDEGFAFPKGVITEYNRERLIERLAQKAKELGAEMIVVGLPRNMDGSEGFKAKECTEAAEAHNGQRPHGAEFYRYEGQKAQAGGRCGGCHDYSGGFFKVPQQIKEKSTCQPYGFVLKYSGEYFLPYPLCGGTE